MVVARFVCQAGAGFTVNSVLAEEFAALGPSKNQASGIGRKLPWFDMLCVPRHRTSFEGLNEEISIYRCIVDVALRFVLLGQGAGAGSESRADL